MFMEYAAEGLNKGVLVNNAPLSTRPNGRGMSASAPCSQR